MPTKTFEVKDSQGTTIFINERRDYENCKYREEFLKAGIDINHISYAYKNIYEFLAVAAEGDMSKYSPEFKTVLIKLGMPKFVFDLEFINPVVKGRSKIMDDIISKNPEVRDFETLCRLQIITVNAQMQNYYRSILFKELEQLDKPNHESVISKNFNSDTIEKFKKR